MTTGYILIVAILILGGVIATVGDRIGTKVGKARLSLFKLRPRKTAVLVTVLTGGLISASTLAVLFAADEGLRTGVFQLEKIQKDLRRKRDELENTRQQLETTTSQKTQVEQELSQARSQQVEAQKRQAEAQILLQEINKSLQTARVQQAQTQAALKRTATQKAQAESQLALTQNELGQISQQYRQAQEQLKSVSGQVTQLRAEQQKLISQANKAIAQRNAAIVERDRIIARLDRDKAEREQKIASLNDEIQQRDQELAQRTEVIAQRETRLKELEKQQEQLEKQQQELARQRDFLVEEVAKLETRLEQFSQSYRDLRLGKLALIRGQVLAADVLRTINPTTTRQQITQLLETANRNAIAQLTEPGNEGVNHRVLKITDEQIKQLQSQINDGREYVVRISSAGNYVRGEKEISVLADAVPNQVVFTRGDIVAAIAADSSNMNEDQLRERIEQLIEFSKFRSRRAGFLGNAIQIGDNRIETLIRFIELLQQYKQPVEIRAVAAEDTYTAGLLKVELEAIQNGQVLFRT
ncbi:MAG: DUF3084 domain-containing protein [Nostocaceae cyanobacterium]|nr:DUF3084 domain-containing protein [Nostocaceae cyanobacterium]